MSLDLVADGLGRQGDWKAVAALLGNGPDNCVSNSNTDSSSNSSDSDSNICNINTSSERSDISINSVIIDNGGSPMAYFESLSGLPRWGRGRASVWQLLRLVPGPDEETKDASVINGLRMNGVLASGEEVLVVLAPHRNPKLNGVKIAFWAHRNATNTHGASSESAQSSSSNELPGLGPCRRLG